MKRLFSVLLVLACVCTSVFAQESAFEKGLTFGFEPSVFDQRLQDLYESNQYSQMSDYRRAKQEQLANAFAKLLPGSTTSADYSRFTVTQGADKWSISTDPAVIEIQPPPMKLSEVRAKLEPLFTAFKSTALVPELPSQFAQGGGGGHIHVDKTVFVNNPLLLRNFLVDVHNRPYVSAVIESLGDHYNNKSIFERGETAQFKTIIGAIDAQARLDGKYDYQKMLDALKPLYEYERYRDINLKNLYSTGTYDPPTVEVRTPRAQKSAKECADLAKLIARHLETLSKTKGPIPVTDMTEDLYWRSKLPTKATLEFKKWVQQELGLSWKNYLGFVKGRYFEPYYVSSKDGRIAVTMSDFFADQPQRELYEVSTTAKVGKVTVNGVEVALKPLYKNSQVRTGAAFLPFGQTVLTVETFDMKGNPIVSLSGKLDLATQRFTSVSGAAVAAAQQAAGRPALESLIIVEAQTVPIGSPRWGLASGFTAAVTTFSRATLRTTRSSLTNLSNFSKAALQTTRRSLANLAKKPVVSSMKNHALGTANFAAALFLKELMVAAETRNLDGVTNLAHQMATPRFWAGYAAFSVGARVSQVGFEKLLAQMAPKILRGVLRSNIALAGGLLAMELLNGTFEPKRFAVTFGSLFVASTIVHAVKWALIGGLVFTGPVGWIILAVDLAVTLYLADKIEGLFTKWLQKAEKSSEDKNLRPELKSVTAPTTGGGGIAEQLEQINEFLDNFSTPPLNQPAE